MRIVLAGALPDPRTTRELLPHLAQAAPNLVAWLASSRTTRIVADPAVTYCTAWEYWLLHEQGFVPGNKQTHSAGLGPLLANTPNTPPSEAIWLAELAHISPARDGAVLLPARALGITAEHSAALLRAAQPYFDGTGFDVQPHTATHWRIHVPDGFSSQFPSPELVSTTTVHEWWRQDIADRPWRRLANELQMLWFDHPVNQQREEQGLMPINSLWLFGGGQADQFKKVPVAPVAPAAPPPAVATTAPGSVQPSSAFPAGQSAATATPTFSNETRGGNSDEVLVDRGLNLSLLEPALAQDWGRWLDIIGMLDSTLFNTLDKHSRLTFTGHDRIIHHTAEQRLWKRWLPANQEAWKKWWSSQD